ncbi:hypothetical protein [Candidatus Palauibacter sp.]|uniref:hypothetical protein n=1 Tax=Candidatus Palauibacter sp. TaxID=3101350 RepID=UPI003B5C8123
MTPAGSPRPDLDEAVETWSRMGDASLLRGVAAVILGFLVLTFGSVIAGRLLISVTDVGSGLTLTDSFIAASLGSRLALAALAGFVTARVAPRAPRVHAGVLAAVLTFFSLAAIAGLTRSGDPVGPSWYPIATLFIGPAGVLAGGSLRRRR